METMPATTMMWPCVLRPQRAHVRPVNGPDAQEEQERHGHEDVGRCSAHGGQRAHLAREHDAAAHGVGDHVEDLGERAADLPLDVHGEHDELEVLRSQAVGHPDCSASSEGRPSRISVSTRWNSLAIGGRSVERDRGHRLLERLPGAQGRSHCTESVAQLILEAPAAGIRLSRRTPTTSGRTAPMAAKADRQEDADSDHRADEQEHDDQAGLDRPTNSAAASPMSGTRSSHRGHHAWKVGRKPPNERSPRRMSKVAHRQLALAASIRGDRAHPRCSGRSLRARTVSRGTRTIMSLPTASTRAGR